MQFEPEVTFPANPFSAARVFLGVLAYPEIGSGQPGSPGFKFANAMRLRMLWSKRKAVGLRQLRHDFGDQFYKPPELREFDGIYQRGVKRLKRRAAAYSMFGTRLLSGLQVESLGASETSTASPLCKDDREIPMLSPLALKFDLQKAFGTSTERILSSDLDRWSRRLSLNHTGSSSDDKQKIKDLSRRAYRQSEPVLHLAHAFGEACRDTGPTLKGWGQGDFILVMLINSEKWVFEAIANAEQWRLNCVLPIFPELNPNALIKLTAQKTAE